MYNTREKRNAAALRWRVEHPNYYETPERKRAMRQAQMKYREKNLDKIRERQKLRARIQRTGCTEDRYNELFELQKGLCAICNKIGDDFNHRRLVPDHNHSTNKIRGLLCNGCNGGLGLFKDNINNLSAAISYLEDRDEILLS